MRHVTDNEMILASAGSGKTYQLTNRYIGLLADGRAPESIVALTFTRKAAGEFFEAILDKLATAASSPEKASALAEQLEREDLTQVDFRRYLRLFIDRMPQLTLGTLDSFFANIVRNFPFEFGLGGGYQILDDHLGAIERERVYRHVFQRRADNAEEQSEFLQSFKLATFGQEESSLLKLLDGFVTKHHYLYLTAPNPAKWGNPATIWPRGTRWYPFETDIDEALRELLESIGGSPLLNGQWERWDKFAKSLPNHSPGNSFATEVNYIVGKLLEKMGDLEMEDAKLTIERKLQQMTPEQCEILLNIANHVVSAELDVRLKRTRGIWMVLHRYERVYSTLVRQRGKLSFFDLALILAGSATGDAKRPILSQRPGGDARMQIDFRLDARFQHWLLDEFQDTSRLQWSVIENLVDEAIQDISGERTFFQVGDVKQAIYAWRGGDVKLFQEIRDRYAEGGRPLREKPLNTSYRSCPDVIRPINLVFGDQAALEQTCGADAVRRWDWREHRSHNSGWSGYTSLFHPEGVEKATDTDKAEARYALMLELLKEADPVGRGHTCAILTRNNKQGNSIVDYIRAHSDIPVINESDIAVGRDNPLSAAILSLFQFAAHPGDTFAREHLRMTPFAAVFEKESLSFQQLSAEILRSIQRKGVEATVEIWLEKLIASGVQLDDFSQRRAGELSNAAHFFDQSGSRDLSEFLTFAGNYKLREPGLRGVVQVLTIHKSKGLGFDVVFLPELGGTSLDSIDEKIAVHRDEAGGIEWIYQVPPKLISQIDPELERHRNETKTEAAYEELCVYYVAMTRAKRANFLIIDEPKKTSTARNFSNHLNATLSTGSGAPYVSGQTSGSILFQSGSREWWSHPSAAPKPPAPPKPERTLTFTSSKPRFIRGKRRTPSDNAESSLPAELVFSRTGGDARAFGRAVHGIFESIEWLTNWQVPEPSGDIETRALLAVQSCLSNPDIAALFTPDPDNPPIKLWREQRFEMLDNKQWISGALDRAHIWSDRAEIIDFKTDKNPGPESSEKYADQIALYRQALAKLTGLPPVAITAKLIFTSTAEIREI